MAQSKKVKKRKKGEQRLLDSRLPVQQPKGIPALKGPSRSQSGRRPDRKSSLGAQLEGHSRSQAGKRHKGSSAATGTEGGFPDQAEDVPEREPSGVDIKGNELPYAQAEASGKVLSLLALPNPLHSFFRPELESGQATMCTHGAHK